MGSYKREEKRSKKVLFVSLAIMAVLLIVSIVAILVVATKVAPIPKEIEKQLTFSPFIVAKSETRDIEMSDFKYDKSNNFLSYIVRLSDNKTYTISEQSSPPEFSEIPESYERYLTSLNKYDTVETFNGSLSLTRPKEGGQVGVMNEKGVLVFIKAGRDTEKETWKRLVESFDIYRIR